MNSRRSVLILFGLCQVLCAIALLASVKMLFPFAVIAFILGLLEAFASEEKSILMIIVLLMTIAALTLTVNELFLKPEQLGF